MNKRDIDELVRMVAASRASFHGTDGLVRLEVAMTPEFRIKVQNQAKRLRADDAAQREVG